MKKHNGKHHLQKLRHSLAWTTQNKYTFQPACPENSEKLLPELNIEDKSLSDEAVDHRSGVFIVCFIIRSSFYLPYDDSSGHGKPSFLLYSRIVVVWRHA